MQTPLNIAKPIPLKSKEPPSHLKYAPHIGRLAAFLQHHEHLNRHAETEANIIEVRRSDAEIAFHLGISMVALEQCFSELIRQNIIRLRGAFQIEILNSTRLSELARLK
ncbi:MAG: helix-turn-helix domain-containing protein [Hyphomicrobium sp.]|uniref:helix-turn-helix domain-containing protein n=1 Tax=Hyphomicrobium sp. TaxID=82 RepID=UPI0035616399